MSEERKEDREDKEEKKETEEGSTSVHIVKDAPPRRTNTDDTVIPIIATWAGLEGFIMLVCGSAFALYTLLLFLSIGLTAGAGYAGYKGLTYFQGEDNGKKKPDDKDKDPGTGKNLSSNNATPKPK